eukprot:TRINITY_DN199_c4_g1_i1.p1 TRINITY_DN199_c4_g1~~TRINITY_DN199_c4_g1_i1.p1  ORF type:complete len:311 (-),score=52.61 TRINITY_DN199_c4_g1_i1:64-996(-)
MNNNNRDDEDCSEGMDEFDIWEERFALWLKEKNLIEYIDDFIEQGIYNVSDLKQLRVEDVEKRFKNMKLGHQRQLIISLDILQTSPEHLEVTNHHLSKSEHLCLLFTNNKILKERRGCLLKELDYQEETIENLIREINSMKNGTTSNTKFYPEQTLEINFNDIDSTNYGLYEERGIEFRMLNPLYIGSNKKRNKEEGCFWFDDHACLKIKNKRSIPIKKITLTISSGWSANRVYLGYWFVDFPFDQSDPIKKSPLINKNINSGDQITFESEDKKPFNEFWIGSYYTENVSKTANYDTHQNIKIGNAIIYH